MQVAAGTYNEDVAANKANVEILGAGIDVSTIIGPIGGGGSTIQVTAGGVVVDGFTITREGNNVTDWNEALNTAGVAVQSQGNTVELRNSKITGKRTGIDINNSNGNSVHNNVIDNNRTGLILRNQTDNTVVAEQLHHQQLDRRRPLPRRQRRHQLPGADAPRNSTFSNNNISGNWYGQIVDRQTGGSLPAPGANLKNFSGNWFGTTSPVITTANCAEPGYAARSRSPSAARPPPRRPARHRRPASANFDITPLLESGTDTALGTPGFQGRRWPWRHGQRAQTGADGRVQEGVLDVDAGGTLHVDPGTFTEQVVIDAKNVTVDGSGSGATTIVSPSSSSRRSSRRSERGGRRSSSRRTRRT